MPNSSLLAPALFSIGDAQHNQASWRGLADKATALGVRIFPDTTVQGLPVNHKLK